MRILARLGVLAMALVFVWAGLEFTRFAWNRTSELADLPLWLIHVAWPVAGVTWIVFAGEQIVDETRILLGASTMSGNVLSAGQAAHGPVRGSSSACSSSACRSPLRSALPACRSF